MQSSNADQLLHAFRTFLGMPADDTTPPACGAVLTAAYDNGRPKIGRCAECDRLVAAQAAARRKAVA